MMNNLLSSEVKILSMIATFFKQAEDDNTLLKIVCLSFSTSLIPGLQVSVASFQLFFFSSSTLAAE